MHSRQFPITTNKYLHSPLVFLSSNFSSIRPWGGKTGGDEISSSLKIKIKTFWKMKTPKNSFDQKSGELLSRENIKIARRTVAKYREMMGYPLHLKENKINRR